ncbi:hypothetical protein FOZ61_009426 [Perkinsus olseni]|uniref:Uncharacterized protein n=1 Tax=Perkinsus olseni TaxID=32597 RepID=A0A7J6L0Q9_PEROL|nr:hypothetical protein FOZ61_009426 [Perkinsus olseni]
MVVLRFGRPENIGPAATGEDCIELANLTCTMVRSLRENQSLNTSTMFYSQPVGHSGPQGCPEVDDASPAVSVVRRRFKRLRIDGEDDEPELSESSGLISGDEAHGESLEGVPEHKRRCTDVSSDKSSIGSSCGDRPDQGTSSPRQSDTPMVASANDHLHHHQRQMQLKQLLKEQMAKYLADYRSLSQRTQIEIPQRLSFTEPNASPERCRPVEFEERNSQPVESVLGSRPTVASHCFFRGREEHSRAVAEVPAADRPAGEARKGREVDERRGTEDKLTRHVQQQVEELVNIVRESEAKTEQDVGQALKVLRSNLSLQMTEASGRHLQKLEKKLSDEFNTVVERSSADIGERLSKEGAEINQRVSKIEALLRRSTERFTDALDPMRATLADLSSRFEEVESKAMLGQPGEGQMSPSRLKQQILAHVEDRLRKFESESLDKIANHRERSPPRECDVEMKLKLQQIERKLAASNPDVRLASMRSETQDSLNAVNQRIDSLQGELGSFRGETSEAINSQTQRLKDHVLGEVKKNAAEAQRREQELSRALEASINSVSDRHDELKKSVETDFKSAVENVRNDSEKSKADNRELSDKVGRIQRELNSLTTQSAELDKTVAEFKEKVNVLSANSSKLISEQITELEKRTTESLAESRSSIMRGFESDLMRITEELDCHVKSVQSSTEERMKGQIEIVKAEIDSKSAETADRLRRMMGSLIELNMRVEKQEDMMSDPKLQRHIRGSVLTLADEVGSLRFRLVDEVIQRSMDADRLEHREMISQLYKKMSDVVSAMHYPKYASCRRSSMVVAATKCSLFTSRACRTAQAWPFGVGCAGNRKFWLC